jgi:hypothetical protein
VTRPRAASPTPISNLLVGVFRAPLWWARLGSVAGLGVLAVVWLARPRVAGDTPFVWDGTNAFIDCLSRGDFVGCRHSGELDYWGLTSPIGDWPLLQHIPDLIAIGFGAEAHHTRELLFVCLSVAGIIGSVVLARVTLLGAGQAAWFWGFLFVVLSGPLMVYGATTAGEALATGLLVLLVAATKETSYPFVVALGVLGLMLAKGRTGSPVRRQLTWGAGGVAIAFGLASLFNLVRFGSVLNTNYLEPQLRTPGLERPLEYALALLVSPNGGIVVYWPAASALVLTACLLPLVFPSGLKLDMRPALVLIGVMGALTLGFASWWDIFGNGYGPRLTLPWVLPIVLIALVAYGESLRDLALRILAPLWRLLLIFAAALTFALPHVGHLWDPSTTAAFAQSKKPPCDAPWRVGVAEFHACQHDLLWFNYRPRPLYSIEGVATVGGAATSVVLAFALFCCLVLLRDSLLSSRADALKARPA